MVATRNIAKMYGVETKRINDVVKRNQNRFPDEFCFRLTEEEFDIVVHI